MIGLVVSAALVVVTYGNSVSVTQNLDDQTCAEAQSVALYGKTVEAKAADDEAAAKAEKQWQATLAARQAEWEAAHPKEVKACREGNGTNVSVIWPCGPDALYSSNVSQGRWATPNDIKYAECVK
jgi:hypothetical protein